MSQNISPSYVVIQIYYIFCIFGNSINKSSDRKSSGKKNMFISFYLNLFLYPECHKLQYAVDHKKPTFVKKIHFTFPPTSTDVLFLSIAKINIIIRGCNFGTLPIIREATLRSWTLYGSKSGLFIFRRYEEYGMAFHFSLFVYLV